MPQKPNILVILNDDMGFSDIGCYGGDLYVSGGIHEVSAGYLTGYARIQSMFNNKHTIGYSVSETTGNPTQDASISACPQITAGNASGRGIHLQEGATH